MGGKRLEVRKANAVDGDSSIMFNQDSQHEESLVGIALPWREG
jgi:hypothetical protein